MKNIKSNKNKSNRNSDKRWNSKRDQKSDGYENDDVMSSDKTRSSKRKDRANNDLNWYFADQNQLRNVASFPFSNALMGNITRSLNSTLTLSSTTPGLCRIDLAPTIGSDYFKKSSTADVYSVNGSDAINIAAKSVYSFVRHANSGHTNYDSPDLMMYLLAMDSLYMLYSHLVRMYGVINLFSYTNRWYPDKILNSMGIKHPEYLRAHAADFRAMINNFGIRLSSFAVPTVMPYFQRHLWLYQNIFLDRKGIKAQSMYFNPSCFYKFVEKTTDGKGYLAVEANINCITDNPIDELTEFINNLLQPIVESEDIGIMSGDILKAYGPGSIFAFQPIPEFYTCIPTYHEGVLPEIHNLNVLGNSNGAKYSVLPVGDIKQTNDGSIYQTFNLDVMGQLTEEAQFMSGCVPTETIIDIPYDTITAEDFTYATRLCCLRDNSAGIDIKHSPITASEVVTGVYIIPWNSWGVSEPVLQGVHQFTDLASAPNMEIALLTTAFDWFPRVNVYTMNADQKVDKLYPMEDISNFTVINGVDLKKLNHSIMFNMFGVPYSLIKS